MYVSYHLPREMKSDLRLPFFIPVCAVARKPLKGRRLADKVKTEAEKSAVNNGRETGRRLLPHERKEKGITMNIIRAKRLSGYEQKGGEYHFGTDYYETGLCTRSCHGIDAGEHTVS